MTSPIDDSNLPQHHDQTSGKNRGRSVREEEAERTHRRIKKHRHKGHHGHEEETSEEAKRPYMPSQTVATRIEEEDRPLFFVDRKGDPQNVVYGGNHNEVIPRYRKAGYGSLIGADRRYRVSEDGLKASGIGSIYDGSGRHHAKSLLNFRDNSRLGREQVRAETIADGEDAIKLQQEYVTVDSKNAIRRKRNARNGGVENALDIVIGRSKDVQMKRKENSSADSSSDSSSDTSPESDREDAYEKFRNHIHRQRSVELTRATLDFAEDIDTWLALIAHQDHASGSDDRALGEIVSTTSKQNLAEIKLALYEKALTRVTDANSRERLVKGLMDQAAVICDVDSLSKKWQAVLKKNSSTNLWIQYLNIIQTNSMMFSYEECLSVQEECLRKARGEASLILCDELSIYILLRITTLMSQSGYVERATAVWQSLLEFTFLRPKQLDPSTERYSFQTFWESEIPRIGESCATGWALSKPFEVLSRSDAATSTASSDDIHERWAVRESEVAMSSTMPSRTIDDVAEDDPFRVILYSDIAEYLFRPTTKSGHNLLINAFLKFCGLPALYCSGSQICRRWWGDELLSSCIHRDQPSLIENTAVSDTKTLFSMETRLSVFPRAQSEAVTAEVAWQRMALRQLVAASAHDDALAEYVVALEASFGAKEGCKYAKSLLKSRPSNLRLYNAYALLECRLDRFETAEHVWSTAITMCQSTSIVEQQDLVLLWSSWIFECLQQRNVTRAEDILSSITSGQVTAGQHTTGAFSNAALRLRTKNYIESHLLQQLSLHQEDSVLQFTELLAFFEYLAGSQSISAALKAYSATIETLTKMSASSLLMEMLHQSRACLLHLHPALSPRGYRPAEINRHLADSLRTFPGNSIFHQLYQEHTQRTGLLERIREVSPMSIHSYESNESNISIVPLLFAIQAEMSRPSYAGSTNHSIRAAFERSVAAAKGSLSLWAWYIKWEVSLHNKTEPVAQIAKLRSKTEIELRRNKAVDVYYRGIRACPWAKDLYMLAFSEAPLRKALGGTELRKIYDVMLEKRLRMHVDLDQFES